MGLKYQSSFTSDMGLACALEIHAKGYSGDVIDIVLTGTPIVHTWQQDESKPPIKGSELVINILNNGSGVTALPITDFIADEDDFFKVVFKVNTLTVFEGYLMQDDYDEILVDYPHEINLKATDNLGLLKDIPLDEAAVNFGNIVPLAVTLEQTGVDKIRLVGTVTVSTGMLVEIDSGTALDGLYKVKTFQYDPGATWTDVIFETVLNGTVVGSMSATFTQYQAVDLSQRMLISDLLALCIKSTNLELDIRVYGTLYPTGAADDRLFDNTMITPESFLSGDTWNSCYDVISKIIGRLGFTLLQAEGFWNLVRWDELRLHANEIPGFLYDVDFVYDSDIVLENFFVSGFEQDTQPEEGLSYTINRPLKFDRETFNYRNPANIIRNLNFEEVGEIISITTTVDEIITDYMMIGWEQGFEYTTLGTAYVGSSAERRIRVITDLVGNEKERFGVIRGNSGFNDFTCAQSNPVEIREGDAIKWSFELRTNVSQPGDIDLAQSAYIMTTVNPMPRSPNNKRLRHDGGWYSQGDPIPPNTGPFINIPAGDDSNTWHNFSIESKPSLVAGKLTLRLPQSVIGSSTTKETHFRSMSFEIIRQLIGTNKIKGHQHTSSHLLNIKNTQEGEIYVDSSLSSAIAGTLLLPTFTGAVQDLVTSWEYNGATYEKLGHITTRDELFLRRTSRLKLEGSFYQLLQDGKILSALSVLSYAQFSGYNFNTGKLSIDYRRDKASCTISELHKNSEEDSDLTEIYGFKYLYESR